MQPSEVAALFLCEKMREVLEEESSGMVWKKSSVTRTSTLVAFACMMFLWLTAGLRIAFAAAPAGETSIKPIES